MANNLENILKSINNVKVIDASIENSAYVKLDLSVKNNELASLDMSNAANMEIFIENYLQVNKAKVAFGGYNEKRNLYKRSTVFNKTDVEERNIHIGVDLWIKAGTQVLAALDGKVHSFQNNTSLGDYGPTIILEHDVDTNVTVENSNNANKILYFIRSFISGKLN